MTPRYQLLAIFACIVSAPVTAAVNYEASDTYGHSATFSLPSPVDATIVNYGPDVYYLDFASVAGVYGGVAGIADIRLYGGGPNNGQGYDYGGFSVRPNNLPYLSGAGAQLFSLNGTTATLFGGTYQFFSESSTLVATVVPDGAVPEPISWAMMVVGFGVIGACLRRREVAVSFA